MASLLLLRAMLPLLLVVFHTTQGTFICQDGMLIVPGFPPIKLPPPFCQSTTTTAKPTTTTPKPTTTVKPATTKATVSTAKPTTTTACQDCHAPLLNWGGNFNFSTKDIKYPTTTAGVVELVKSCKGKIRPIGTRHSFTTIGDTPDTLISLVHMNSILAVDPSIPAVTVQAGITYTDLAPFLESVGLALPMLASLGEISIAGACATGVHGSGSNIGSLATQVHGLQMVLANGTVVQWVRGRNDDMIHAAAVGLGALGIITEVTLKVEPTFQLAINVFQDMSMHTFKEHFDDIVNAGYAVNLWSDWSTPNLLNYVWITSRIDANNPTNNYANVTQLHGANAALTQTSPIAALPPTYVVPQLGRAGPWHERLSDYALGLSGMEGQQTQSEYYVRYDVGADAMLALQNLSAEIRPVVYCSLFRVIDIDGMWMSYGYNQKTIAIHFSWTPQLNAVMALLPKIEAQLAPFKPIPHWGKLYTMKPSQYLPLLPKYNDWKAVVEKLDPTHKFRNTWLDQNIFV